MNEIKIGFNFGSVYVRDMPLARVGDALRELMAESDRLPCFERGIEPTPNTCTCAKLVRSFALLPQENGWIAVLEDGHALDDGGVAEGLSDLLLAEALHLSYSDEAGGWGYERYCEGQPLESGGSHDADFDVSAFEFVAAQGLPHFGVYYEEVAAAAAADAPSLAGSLHLAGDIHPRLPIGTEILTFRAT